MKILSLSMVLLLAGCCLLPGDTYRPRGSSFVAHRELEIEPAAESGIFLGLYSPPVVCTGGVYAERALVLRFTVLSDEDLSVDLKEIVAEDNGKHSSFTMSPCLARAKTDQGSITYHFKDFDWPENGGTQRALESLGIRVSDLKRHEDRVLSFRAGYPGTMDVAFGCHDLKRGKVSLVLTHTRSQKREVIGWSFRVGKPIPWPGASKDR